MQQGDSRGCGIAKRHTIRVPKNTTARRECQRKCVQKKEGERESKRTRSPCIGVNLERGSKKDVLHE